MTYPEFQPARNLFWKQRKIPFFALFFLFFLGTMLIISIFSPSQANAPLPSSISSGTLSELDVQPSSGFIAPKIGVFTLPSPILITSEFTATVQAVHSSTGEQVKGGQPVITLFDQLGTYTSQLTTAQATIDALQTRYDTTQLTAHQQLQEADLNIMTLQQLFSQTEQRLQTFIITSQSLPHPTPFSGTSTDTGIDVSKPSLSGNQIEQQEILSGEGKADGKADGKDEVAENVAALQVEHIAEEREQEKQAILATLYDLENQLETAKLQYELLKTTSSNELETLSAQLQLARKEYETLYTTYNKLSVRAPLAGTIAQLFVTPGESISKGSPLFTLIPHTALPTLTVALSFNEYLTALPLNEVEIVLPDSFPSPHIFTGSISTRSPIANENEMYTLTIQSSVPLPEGLTECEVRFATF